MTFQFSIWDKFRDLENLPATNFSNLVHLVAHLLKTKSLSLSILKVGVTCENTESSRNGGVIVYIRSCCTSVFSSVLIHLESACVIVASTENGQTNRRYKLTW